MTILLTVPLWPSEESRLEALAADHGLGLRRADGKALAALTPEEAAAVRVVVTDGHEGLSTDAVARLPGLGLVASASAGMENIDEGALRARGIPLANPSPALAGEVADLAMLLLLAAWRDLRGLDAHVRTGAWATTGPYPLGRALAGRRLGILGLGSIGRAAARRAEAFGLAVAYTGRSPKDAPYPFEPDLRRLAGDSDALLVAVPGGPETRGLVDRAVIDALGPHGVLVNVARGSVVDEPALVAALEDGRLGAAGLDVFRDEPDVDGRLRALPNVVLTPHAGSATGETREAMSRLVVDNVDAFLSGRPLPSRV